MSWVGSTTECSADASVPSLRRNTRELRSTGASTRSRSTIGGLAAAQDRLDLSRRRQTQLLELPVERRPVDPEELGGALDLLRVAERPGNELAFVRGERGAARFRVERQVVGADRIGSDRDRAANDVLELAHVPGPLV